MRPVAGATTTYTYDAYGRVRTVTDPDGYAITTDYDVFDRPTRRTYPDGTYDTTTYDRLDVSTRRDRAGRITRYSYDALRRLIATRDPAGRVVTQQWSVTGDPDALVDANGNRTAWERDVQGRVVREVRADGITATLYSYGARTGRLLTVTDPKDQVTTYAYAADNQRLSMTFTNAQIATPSVSFTYDAAYSRLASVIDGAGVTTYAYHAPGLPGGGRVASVDGPLATDTITYTYDALGRIESRGINGTANLVTWGFDTLGRVELETNLLGTFTYAYDGLTSRLASVIHPNGQTSSYSYFDNLGDRRLQTIHHKYPSGATLAKFDYTYDTVGNIVTWRQQGDSDAVLWTYGYDRANQLTSAIKAAEPTQGVLTRYAYAYDPAGNRTVEQIDDQMNGASYDNLNRLVTQQPAGKLLVAGTVSEPATVTVQGLAAPVTAANVFTAKADVAVGTNVLAVTASDASGNTATAQFEIDSLGAGRSFSYDANGNMTSDGVRIFDWDARNQLVAVTVAAQRSEFAYDGLQRRVRETVSDNGVVRSDTRVLWCEREICEERALDGTTVVTRSFKHGQQTPAGLRFLATDHLGSVIAISDTSMSLLARYAYDPWGRRTTTGINVTSETFTGHRWHPDSSLLLTLYRGYDPELGMWISEDPIGLVEGPNFYRYVAGNPIRFQDPLGLAIHCTVSRISEQLVGGKCPPGSGACTQASMLASAGGCRESCGKWSFTGTVDMKYAITYLRHKQDRGADRNPFEMHEWLHIGDLQSWCSGLTSKYPSEGFSTNTECMAARTRFLNDVRGSLRDAQRNSTNNRDK
jgi:RHS repeat-associated protein